MARGQSALSRNQIEKPPTYYYFRHRVCHVEEQLNKKLHIDITTRWHISEKRSLIFCPDRVS